MCSEKNICFPCIKNINRSIHLCGQLTTTRDMKYTINSLYSESTRYLYKQRLENRFEKENFQNVKDNCVYITNCIHETARDEQEQKITRNRASLSKS
jgi:hypothetical protein